MMGLMSSKTVMMESVDQYNDRYNLQDIQIYSNYGFCSSDVYRIMNTEGVKDVFASKTTDVNIIKTNGDSGVARLHELDRNINKIELSEGRLPSGKDECVVLGNGFRIGDIVRFDKEDIDAEIEKNMEKAKKKREKKGVTSSTLMNSANISTKTISEKASTKTVAEKEESLKKINEYYAKNKIKPGGIAAKANLVRAYNENNSSDSNSDKEE